jgi:uncharacterized protein (DUF934 family)
MTGAAVAISKIIKLQADGPRIVEDDWTLIRDPIDADAMGEYGPKAVPPLAAFLAMDAQQAARVRAVWIAPDDDFEPVVSRLLALDMIAVDFPVFRDGRGYSIATLLRTRYGWQGELRAIGDVLRDQLNYMRRCGFDAFAIRADKDMEDAMKSFGFYTVTYQGGVDDPAPLFRRRARQEQA